MNRPHARPMAEHQRAQRARAERADVTDSALFLAGILAVFLALALAAPDPNQTNKRTPLRSTESP